MPQNRIRAVTQIQAQGFASNGDIFTDKEDHSAECNGVLQDFDLLNEAFHGSEHVFLRGTLRREEITPGDGGEYTISVVANKTRIHFLTPPDTGDDFVVSYRIKYTD